MTTKKTSKKSTSKKKTTEIADLPPSRADADALKGGVMQGRATKGTVCTTGLLSTCSVQDTKVDTWCGTGC